MRIREIDQIGIQGAVLELMPVQAGQVFRFPVVGSRGVPLQPGAPRTACCRSDPVEGEKWGRYVPGGRRLQDAVHHNISDEWRAF